MKRNDRVKRFTVDFNGMKGKKNEKLRNFILFVLLSILRDLKIYEFIITPSILSTIYATYCPSRKSYEVKKDDSEAKFKISC